jgi:predicted secreted hydrolase
MRARHHLIVLLASLAACGRVPDEGAAPPPVNTGLRYLGGQAESGFARVTEPREFVFPQDHATHPEYQTEWWYFTGNLETARGRHFGFELTFFRYAIAPPAPVSEGASTWRTEQIWMANLAITDSVGRRFFARERVARAALGLAGATANPLHIAVKDWSVAGQGSDDQLALRLEAQDDRMGVSLDVSSTVPPIAHGDRGLDRKGAGFGNASYYYSVPRLSTAGAITVEGETYPVTGLAWMDREWSTSSLEPGIVGWDWFALHLSDGRSLMFYRLRTTDGESSPFSSGSLVSVDGQRTALTAADISLRVLGHWTSPATGVRYPIAWRLEAPLAELSLEITPYLDDQEVDLSVRYWEGAIRASGVGPAGPTTAQGYMELAGY